MNISFKIVCFIFFITIISSIETYALNQADSITLLKKNLESIDDPEDKLKALINISVLLKKTANTEALAYAKKSLESAKNIGDKKQQAKAAHLIGTIYFEYGDLKNALSHNLLALGIYKELGHQKGYIAMLNNIGNIESGLKNFDKAYSYFYQALLLNKAIGDSNQISTNLNNIGVVFSGKHKRKEALYYYKQAYTIGSLASVKDTFRISMCLNNLAEAYMNRKDYDNAITYSNESIRLSENAGMIFSLTLAYLTRGNICLKKQDYRQAKKYCLLALDLAEKHQFREQRALLYQTLSTIFEATMDVSQALLYQKRYHTLYDSLYNEKNTKQIHQMAALYESDIKDEQIKSLGKDKEIAFAKADRERVFTNLIFLISILIITMGFIVARNLVLKHRKRLSEEKALIEIQKKRFERDNARLMHENVSAQYEVLKSKINPHFLFNSLAALSSIIPEEAYQAEEFIEHFSDFYRKIIETSDVELLPLHDEMKIVETYLYLQQIAVGKNLIVDINIDQQNIQLLVPPFAVQMIVENAIKHNEISSINPLKISIFTNAETLVIANTIRKRTNELPSTGIGEKNIIERYKLFSSETPEFRDAITAYIVTLPLLKEKEYRESIN
jgi:tetratricopeptide (TPR) repeat protein